MNLTIELPDELASRLEGISATRGMSIQQLALDRLRGLVNASSGVSAGSAAGLLSVMNDFPLLSSADVDELDAAIARGRLPVKSADLF